jgi:hypothetical protein
LRQGLRPLCGSGGLVTIGRDGLSGCQRFGELLQARINFFKSFGPGGEKAFERDTKIGFENIALPLLGFIGIEVIGGGNGVAALMLGEIHRSVGNLDEFLRRGAVQRITGDAEAGADIFLAQQGIGGNPTAQLG